MTHTYVRRTLGVCTFLAVWVLLYVVAPFYSSALNISTYSDVITDSAPLEYANHTLSFILTTDMAPSGYFQIDMPAGFEIVSTSTFAERNVEMSVNTSVRASDAIGDAVTDQVIITPGSPGSIQYHLNSTTGISAGSSIVLKIGDHTSAAFRAGYSYSTTTGTTTIIGDIKPIRNSSQIGTHLIALSTFGTTEPAYANFSIAVVDNVSTLRVNTTELIPPYRFNGNPTGTVGGTTFNVELSLETDELTYCRYSLASGTPYFSMNQVFPGGLNVIHSIVVGVATGTVNHFYVRCIDDEGNFNIDDYDITFISLPPPVGDPNDEGDVEGDGSGSGDSGTGGGEGTGGSTGGSNGGGGGSGGSSGGGGGSSGGGSGGDKGDGTNSDAGGGFESTNGPYRSGDAEVIISGYAFPGSTVYALVDGFQTTSVRASASGAYSLTITAIARGVYTFGVYAVGSDSKKSSTFSTSFTVTGGRTSNLSNINIMPSITVSPDPVTPGQQLTVSGRSIPSAEITIENQNSKSAASKKSYTATAGSNGLWSLTIDTTGFTAGTYKIRAKSKQLDGTLLETNFSEFTFYGVGQSADVPLSADLNRDGKINLTDFSILLFWWGGDGGTSNPPADINRDGKVSLTDFSILLFNWTG